MPYKLTTSEIECLKNGNWFYYIAPSFSNTQKLFLMGIQYRWNVSLTSSDMFVGPYFKEIPADERNKSWLVSETLHCMKN